MATKHKNDIKVFYAGSRSLTEPVTIPGFELYAFRRTDTGMRKDTVGVYPLIFDPVEVEDGMMVSHVSDTTLNRTMLRELVGIGMVLVADDKFLAEDGPAIPVEPVGKALSMEDMARLNKMRKTDLYIMAQEVGLKPDVSWTRETLIARLSNTAKAKEEIPQE